MLEKWKVLEVLCVLLFIVFLKNCKWSALRDIIDHTLLETDGNVTDVDSIGDETIRNPIPYQVAILTESANKPLKLCGGSIISKNYVLTAAHCLQGVTLATIILNPGSFDYVAAPKSALKSAKFKIHPQWKPNILLNDIALVEVQTQGYTARAIALPSNGNISNKKGTINGWEKNSDNKESALNLKIYNVTIIENEECKRHFGSLVQETNLCTESIDFNNGCHGFSGSPLVVEGIQVALVSFGTDRCNIGYPTVHTRVSEYAEWINENSDVLS